MDASQYDTQSLTYGTYQIALHPAMTVIRFFTLCPRIGLQRADSFGAFPFRQLSSASGASGCLLLKHATSILLFNFFAASDFHLCR